MSRRATPSAPSANAVGALDSLLGDAPGAVDADAADRSEVTAAAERPEPGTPAVAETSADPATTLPGRSRVPAPEPIAAASPEPLLAGRYRLQRRLAGPGPAVVFRAVDVVLARPVAVRLLAAPAAGPALTRDQLAEFLDAATAAGQLADPAAAATFDADLAEDPQGPAAYVVTEWVDGTPLHGLLAEGPLPPPWAAGIVLAVARVLARAHARGVAHGDLGPGDVLLTAAGRVKVTDFRTGAWLRDLVEGRAVAAGTPASEPESESGQDADLRALGALLYCALTARWPLAAPAGLAPAPRNGDGRVCRPRQVRAGVPRDLDELCMLLLDGHGPGRPTSAAATAAALTGLLGPGAATSAGLPALDPAAATVDESGPEPSDVEQAHGPLRRRDRQRPHRRWLPLAGVLTLVAVLAGAVVLGVLALRKPASSHPAARATPTPTTSARQTPRPRPRPSVVLPVVAASSFDPYGNDGIEQPQLVPLAHDGNPATAWYTETYQGSAQFGGLKPGVGIRLDLGRRVAVSRITLTLTAPGSDVELRAADVAGAARDDYPVVSVARGVGTTVTLRGSRTPRRYWLVWLTRLAPSPTGGFVQGVDEVTFHS